uniref:Trichome birefringence-like C-terminal domain-containing protein n=1 Tax=Solanum tuberosum TaxID=4113 RepID=M1BNK7_SOLTU
MFNSLIKPLYTDRTCPYIDKQYSCIKNGRKDSYYLHWEWKPDDCMLPRWGEFENGEEGYEELETAVSYRVALRTWANWIDSTIDPSKTKVFFTTMSPSHQKNKEWGNVNGIRCFNETRPVTKKGHWGTGSNKEMMNVVASVMRRMKVPVTVLNVTQLSEYRIDAHTSIYGELQGKLLTNEQRADPLHFADCIHWCLPGVPDTWNQLLFAYL